VLTTRETTSVVEALIDSVAAWAMSRTDVRALALVGSRARGDARPDSDVDFVVLVERPEDLLRDTAWVGNFGQVSRLSVEDWGRVTAVRAWYANGVEVEFGLATTEWATNADAGTSRVLSDGVRVLIDRDGNLARLVGA
jgi:predicted nucleotidyltransferase